MRVVAVRGRSGSGKTETLLALVAELRRRGWSVVAAKDVHHEGFSVDTPGKDSFRLGHAGGEAVVVRGPGETAFIFRRPLSLAEIAAPLAADFLLLEGFRDANCANIVCAEEVAGLAAEVNAQTFAVSGRVAGETEAYGTLPAVSALSEAGRLADLVEAKASVTDSVGLPTPATPGPRAR